MAFVCKCGNTSEQIIIRGDKIGCPDCLIPIERQRSSGGVIVRGENKVNPKMTHADLMHIKTRKIGKDGMVHADPRWETKDF